METPNEYFLKKQEKEQEMRSKARRAAMTRVAGWSAVLIVVIAAGYGIWSWIQSQRVVGPVPGEFFPAQSRDHIRPGDQHPAYNSNPPTGGWHYDNPAQSGIYDKEFPDEQIIHNLEHSHIWIAYRPDLIQTDIEKLADIAKSYGSKIIMMPRAANDVPIAIVAWEHLLKLDGIDEAQIQAFIKAHRGVAGPEKIPDFGFKDFRTQK